MHVTVTTASHTSTGKQAIHGTAPILVIEWSWKLKSIFKYIRKTYSVLITIMVLADVLK